MDDPITWQSLGTVAVASGAAASAVAFIRLFKPLSPAVARQTAAIFGVLIVELAVVALGARGWKEIVLGLFTGIAAGLAASKSVEISLNGWGHTISGAQSATDPGTKDHRDALQQAERAGDQ